MLAQISFPLWIFIRKIAKMPAASIYINKISQAIFASYLTEVHKWIQTYLSAIVVLQTVSEVNESQMVIL